MAKRRTTEERINDPHRKGLLGSLEKGRRKGGEGRGAPLEVVGDSVLEAGRRVDLPLRELLLQAACGDLAQRLHGHNPRNTGQG